MISIAGTGLFPQTQQQIGIHMIKRAATEFTNEDLIYYRHKVKQGKNSKQRMHEVLQRFGIIIYQVNLEVSVEPRTITVHSGDYTYLSIS